MYSELCSKPSETCCLCCFEVLLKADSVTDLKTMFQGTYKDTRLTLTETVLLYFLLPTLTMVLFGETLSKATTRGVMKNNPTKCFGNFQVKIWHRSFIAKQLSTISGNSVRFVGNTWNLTKKDSYSSSQIHKSMPRYHKKDIKMLDASLPTFKMFFFLLR